MIPCLYDEKETAFLTNGIGKLCDAFSCVVTEKRNGSYELKMEYPSDGLHAEELVEGSIVLAKPSEKPQPQPFQVYKIATPISGKLVVYGRHIQYRQNYLTVSPFTASGCVAAMQGLKDYCTTENPFTFWTDIDSSATFLLSTPATVRSCLGGMEGSLLDVFGGEYEWDMFETCLHARRGADYGVRIVYGKNLVDFQMERSIENIITGVHPYWKHSEDGTIVQLPERVVTIENHKMPYEKISVLDCTSQFDEKPSENQLRSYAKSYLKNTALTEPDIDITVDFIQLWQKPGYEDIAAAERVSLCDTVHVYIDKLGLEVACKVTETEYDVLLERYRKITLSNASVYSRNSSLSTALGSLSDQAALATEAINRVQATAGDTRTFVVQQEYYNNLLTGMLGLHYESGMEDDGSAVRYAYTGETKEASDFIWKYGANGLFVSTDGGSTWSFGWEDSAKVVKLAVEAVGLSFDTFQEGTLRTALVKILGTEDFYWNEDAIVMTDPKNETRQMKIGQYETGKYGIAVSKDGGKSWTEAVGFDGVAGQSGVGPPTTVVQGEVIIKSKQEPDAPVQDDLWIDKSMTPPRIKLWTGTEWVIVGYEPADPPTDPEEPPTDPVEPTEPTEPVEPIDPTGPTDTTEPTDPQEPVEDTDPAEPEQPTEPDNPNDPSDPTTGGDE